MDFLNDLGKRFTRVARSVQERTREGWDSSRLSADLYSLRGDLERQYTALGEAYFKAVSAGEEVPQELVSRVKATVDRIDELTALRENRVRCPACGSFQAPEARFCSKCGNRMPEDAPEPVEEPAEEDEGEYCPECGAMRHEDSNFCAVCGHAFSANAAKEEPEAPAKPEPAAPSEPPAEEPDHEPDEEE